MEEKVEKKKSTAKKVFDVIVNIVIVLYLIGTVLISISIFSTIGNDEGVPNLFGYSFMNVVTDSMQTEKEDSIDVGDLAICETPEDRYALKVGDIIAFRTSVFEDNEEEKIIIKLHRIVEINDDGHYLTAGDNVKMDEEGNPMRDAGSVIPTKVLGLYTGTKISGGGDVYNFLTGQQGIMICLVIPMAIFFIWALFKFIKALVELKYSKVATTAGGELSEEQKQAAIAEYLAKKAAEENEEDNNEENNTEDSSEE